MKTNDLQLLYVVLILPSLFGLTMIGEGLNKVLKSEKAGIISIVVGFIFIVIVVLAYFFVSGKLNF